MGKSRNNRKKAMGQVAKVEPALDAPSSTNQDGDSGDFKKKKPRLNNFQRAKAVFDQIQDNKRAAREQRNQDKERREKALNNYMANKKKMNKALRMTTRKGQPKLGAQVAVILEKLQREKK